MAAWRGAFLRKVRGSDLLRRFVAWAARLYVRFVQATTRWTVDGDENRQRIVDSERPNVLAMWHGRFHLSLPDKPEPREALAIVSANRDGDMVARFLAGFGVGALRGSSWDLRKGKRDKHAASAVREALRRLRQGALLVVTPDGPRGPRMRVQPGVATLSALSQAPVTPFAYATRWGWVAPSWDRMFIPSPFCRGVKVWGAPIPAPETRDDASLEAHRLRIEQALIEACERADRLVGRRPVAPAEPVA